MIRFEGKPPWAPMGSVIPHGFVVHEIIAPTALGILG